MCQANKHNSFVILHSHPNIIENLLTWKFVISLCWNRWKYDLEISTTIICLLPSLRRWFPSFLLWNLRILSVLIWSEKTTTANSTFLANIILFSLWFRWVKFLTTRVLDYIISLQIKEFSFLSLGIEAWSILTMMFARVAFFRVEQRKATNCITQWWNIVYLWVLNHCLLLFKYCFFIN